MKRWIFAMFVAMGISLAQGYAMVEVASYGETKLFLAYDIPVFAWTLSPYVFGQYAPGGYALEAGLELLLPDWKLGLAWNSRYGAVYRLTWVVRFGR